MHAESTTGGVNRRVSRNIVSRSGNLVLLATVLAVAAPFGARAADPSARDTELRERSVGVIRQALDREAKWIKIHAAEYLLALDYTDGVKAALTKEGELHGDEPNYRIGIWRVLARTSHSERERDQWIGKIRKVCFDPAAPERIHATETLAKLRYHVDDDEAAAMHEAALSDEFPLAPYAAWVLLNSARPGAEATLAGLLMSPNPDARCGAAYALRHRASISAATEDALLAAVRQEAVDSKARVFLVAAAVVHAPPARRAPLKAEALQIAASGRSADRLEACQALAQIGEDSDRPRLAALLNDSNPDLRASAAAALLSIERRRPHRLVPWDWAVIGVYLLGMLCVGWYYSRRTKTREQYLLGDRKMRPMIVGISLFASLISTVSYLAWPGEIIKYGPMLFTDCLAFPLVGLVVGWLIIPFIMRLKVTSAYEILEIRLGATVRTVGSLLFLSLRLLWMSVIAYAATSKVLIPLLGLSPAWTPLVCALLAFVTIAYTAMGGLRAVVITDVIQTAILLGAAVITIVVITISLGGVQAWWPHQWPAHWPEPHYGYDSTARVTMFGAILAAFTWYVCTSTSDQICVQRYLSTRNATAARTVLFVSLAANVLVIFLLAAVGLGLLAYFQSFPYLLSDTQSVFTDSDKLFPQFIIIGLPVGLSGLVVAGLLACAMSALSAGINSTCSVITVDIVDRFRPKNRKAESGGVGQLKYVSVVVGVIVVLLSLLVNMVPGNLIEICYKVVNLFTAPLAGLFFLAMFVPWARGFGALVGTVCGLAVAVAVSYWKEITGNQGISFLWAMPLSLAAEVGVGAIVSLLPIGHRAQMIMALPTSPESAGVDDSVAGTVSARENDPR